MIKSTFDLEKELLSNGYDFVIGVDEAGRGPLAGPVVAAATLYRNFQFPISNFQTISNNQILNDKIFFKNLELIRDSKTLSEKQRENIFDFICDNFFVGLGICNHETIDRMNILEASFLAMKKAIANLIRNKSKAESQKSKELERIMILVDGNKKIPNFSMDQRAIVGGDKIVKSISAASIVAKVTRDKMMKEFNEKYPQYGFDKHKGYGTKFHLEALQKNGPSEIHRKTFEPVKSLVKKGK